MGKFKVGDKVRINVSKLSDGDYKETCLNPLMQKHDGMETEIVKVNSHAGANKFYQLYNLDLPDSLYNWNWHEDWLEPVSEAPIAPAKSPQAPDAILKSALKHMEDRAKTYDSPEGERSMGKTVEAFNAITGHSLKVSEGWLLMALLKMVRATQRNEYHADSYEDMAAYVGLAAEAKAQEGYTNEIN